MTAKEALPIWWSFIWRSVIAGIVAGFVAGAIAGFFAALLGHPNYSGQAGGIAGWLASIAVSFWALWATLKKYRLRPVSQQI